VLASNIKEQEIAKMAALFHRNPNYLRTIQHRFREQLPRVVNACKNTEEALGIYLIHLHSSHLLPSNINLNLALGGDLELLTQQRLEVLSRI